MNGVLVYISAESVGTKCHAIEAAWVNLYEKAKFPKGKIKPSIVQGLDEKVAVFTRFDFADLPKMADGIPVIVPPVSTEDFHTQF